jgi:hypothetical protein
MSPLRNAFFKRNLVLSAAGRVFYFRARSEEDRDVWVQQFNDAIGAGQKLRRYNLSNAQRRPWDVRQSSVCTCLRVASVADGG